MPPRSVAALLALLLVVVAGVVTPAAAARAGGAADQSPLDRRVTVGSAAVDGSSPALANGTTPPVRMVVEIRPDGDARWRVSTWFVLETENDTDAFRRLATQFENGNTEQLGLRAFRAASERAAEVTGRSMDIVAVSRNASISNETTGDTATRTATAEATMTATSTEPSATRTVGRLVLEFTWTNFARVEGDRLYVGDAFNTSQGTWLPGLAARQTLILRPPPEYGVYGAPIGPDNGTLRWEGPTTFGSDGPWAIYQGSQPDTETPSDSFPGDLPLWGAVFVGGLGLAAVAVYVLRGDRFPVPDEPAEDGQQVTTEREAGADAGTEPVDTDHPPEDATTDVETEPEPNEPTTEAETSEEDQAIDETLLSDEERIERLLERNGGRMKQATIVRETGWSNAKVSQLLSSMADEGRVEKLRLGRENLISFPDEDVTDFES